MAKKRRDVRDADSLSSSAQTEMKSSDRDSEILKEAQQSIGGSTRMSLLILASIFACSASIMYLVYRNFPELPDDEMEKIKIPKDMDDAKALGTVLSKYKDTYYTQVLVAYFATYVFQPSDVCYPRIDLPQHPVWLSLPFPFGSFLSLLVLWTWSFLLLHAVVSGGQTGGLQIPHREGTEMVPAG